MRGTQLSRKAAFKAALAYAGTTQKAWCEARGITVPHLYRVLSGDRPSLSLTTDVDAFIAAHTPRAVRAA